MVCVYVVCQCVRSLGISVIYACVLVFVRVFHGLRIRVHDLYIRKIVSEL